MWASWVKRSAIQRWCKSLVQNSPSGLCLLLANYLVSSHLTGPWILPKIHVEIFAKINPTIEAYGYISTLIMRWGLLPLWPSRNLPTHVQTRKSSLTSGVGTLSLLQQSSTFATNFVLGVRTKLEFYSTWQIPGVQPRGPLLLQSSVKNFICMHL